MFCVKACPLSSQGKMPNFMSKYFQIWTQKGGHAWDVRPRFPCFIYLSQRVPKKEKVTNFVGVPLSCDPMFSSSQILYILFILACLLAEPSQAKFQ